VPSNAKQPVLLKWKIRLEQQANELLEDPARFIGVSAEELLNVVPIKMMTNYQRRAVSPENREAA